MTAKQFFTSNAFKCIVVLTVIALIAGGLLAILNDVLYVSDEERTKQAIKKIYDKDVSYTEVELLEEQANNDYGEINSVLLLEDGNYLIKATGNNGYKNGTVSLWIVARFENNQFKGLDKIEIAGYDKQTLMSSFKKSFYEEYTSHNDEIIKDGMFDKTSHDNSIGNVTSGATFSSNACNRAVNCALVYIRAYLVK